MPWNFDEEQLKNKLVQELKMPRSHFLKLISDLDYLLKATYFSKINYIILFGSCSKGVATLRSDIDLCVMTSEELTRHEKADIRVTLNDDTHSYVETNVVILTEKNYREYYTQQSLYRQIGEGLQIYYKEGVK